PPSPVQKGADPQGSHHLRDCLHHPHRTLSCFRHRRIDCSWPRGLDLSDWDGGDDVDGSELWPNGHSISGSGIHLNLYPARAQPPPRFFCRVVDVPGLSFDPAVECHLRWAHATSDCARHTLRILGDLVGGGDYSY